MMSPTPQSLPMLRNSAGFSRGLHAYTHDRQQALQRFATNGRISALWRTLTQATDTLLAAVADQQLTVIAVGGYGRCELFPHSDVDILILADDAEDNAAAKHVILALQYLWDTHIPVSHATRTFTQTLSAAQRDHTIAAALMDARLVCGDRKTFLQLKKRLKHDVFGHDARQFAEAKLRERDTRHAKWGDSRFVLEPNVKEGKGGLRDLQTLTWLARHCYGLQRASELVRDDLLTRDEWQHYRHAYEFFSTVRGHLHLLRGRADERLTFDAQLHIAEAMHFPGRTPQTKAEALMLRYFQFARHVGNLTRIFCAILEEENLRIPHAPFSPLPTHLPDYLTLTNGRLNYTTTAAIAAYPHQMIGLFAAGHQYGFDIHPRAHLALSRALPYCGHHLPTDALSNQLFLHLLLEKKSTDITLRRMNEMGVLGALIPEFGRIVGQMQYDGYHTYTVDEHTLVAVANLATIESGAWIEHLPLSTELARNITDRAPLYVALLCHDIAKGQGGGHAEKGEILVQRVAARLGLNAGQSELTAWLVRHHSVITDVAFKRDLEDPKTIGDFVALVQSPERLRLLLLLTVADIKAVGPTIWNPWKGSLMRELYQRALAAMGVTTSPVPDHRDAENLAYLAWTQHGGVGLHVQHDEFRSVTEISCCVRFQRDLFRLLCGVMAWMGASIVSARVRMLPGDAALVILDIQDLQERSFSQEKRRLAQLPELIDAALAGTLNFADELPTRRRIRREREVSITPSIYIDNDVSAQFSVIEINARDRIGLLYDMLSALEQCGLQVMTAHIATYGTKAVDVFYVKDAFGLKVYHWTKQAQLQQTLLAAIAPHA